MPKKPFEKRSNGSEANATTLRFPSEYDLNQKERVPHEAMDLINSLLQEREHRLCSKKYSLNDTRRWTRANSHLMPLRAEKPPQDYQGHYVYPDDAVDIKAHPFFRGLAWDTIHLSPPPFIPEVRSEADTRYFDDDQISDVDDGSSEQDPLNPIGSLNESGLELHCSQERLLSSSAKYQGEGQMYSEQPMAQFGGNGPHVAGDKAARRKEKKRPRDRVLRDKEVGRKVLELRKKGAFLGYAYQRPATVVYDDERGRQGITLKN